MPSDTLKIIQVRILKRILSRVESPSYCWAFEEGKSIRDMAKVHEGKTDLLSFDIRDFFPSVTQTVVENLLISEGVAEGIAARTLSELCTYKWFLPQGGVTSPKLSNLVVKHTFGMELEKVCKDWDLSLTIYADDITISPGKSTVLSPIEMRDGGSTVVKAQEYFQRGLPGTGHTFTSYLPSKVGLLGEYHLNGGVDFVKGRVMSVPNLTKFIAEKLEVAGFRMNKDKTKWMKKGHRRYTCGAVVNETVNLSRKQRLRLRAMVHNVEVNGVEAESKKYNPEGTVEEFVNHLRGKLNWYAQLNPTKGKALADKFTSLIAIEQAETAQNSQ